ncbi:3-hydroxybutyryl-CoA dehydratase [Rhizobiaceae bacterium]|nr:3-hydroxybutyryl-CoA dehydratase [Rhizobiaceae bacterium]
MGKNRFTFTNLPGMAGEELGVSSWVTVDQDLIDRFAETTGDRQWIHVDVERARRETPFGSTIAHGYLTLSLVAVMSYEIGAAPEGAAMSVNYGLDKLRFLSPVKAGSRVRLRSRLVSFEEKSPGQFLMRSAITVEIEGEERPALAAEALVLFVR